MSKASFEQVDVRWEPGYSHFQELGKRLDVLARDLGLDYKWQERHRLGLAELELAEAGKRIANVYLASSPYEMDGNDYQPSVHLVCVRERGERLQRSGKRWLLLDYPCGGEPRKWMSDHGRTCGGNTDVGKLEGICRRFVMDVIEAGGE